VKLVKARNEAGLENGSNQDLLLKEEDTQGNIPLGALSTRVEKGHPGSQVSSRSAICVRRKELCTSNPLNLKNLDQGPSAHGSNISIH